MFVFFMCGNPARFFCVEKNAAQAQNLTDEEKSAKNAKNANSASSAQSAGKNLFNARQPDLKKDFYLTFYGDNKKNFAVDAKTSFSQTRFSFCEDAFNFGISAFSYKFLPSFPFVLKAGNLTEGGSLSKLKSLALSGGNSPFSANFSSAGGIYSGLPGYTSFSKPASVFSEIGFANKNFKTLFLKDLKLDCFYSPEKENFAFSLSAKSSFLKNKIKSTFSFTSGIFSYDERFSSAWFSDDLFFPGGKHFCSLYQFTFEFPFYKTTFSLGNYENPFGIFSNVYRLDNSFSLKSANFSFSAYYNPNSQKDGVLSASGSVLQDVFQFRSSFVHKIRLKNGFLRNGVSAYSKTGLSENFSDLKFSLGSQFNSILFSASFYVASNFKITREFDNRTECELKSVSAVFSNRWYFAILSPALSANVSLTFSDNRNVVNSASKIAAKVYFQKNPKINAESSYSFSIKNGEVSSQHINFSIYSKFSVKKINFLCNLGWKTEL